MNTPPTLSRLERETATHPVAVAARMFAARATSLVDSFHMLVLPLNETLQKAEDELEHLLSLYSDPGERELLEVSPHSMPLTKQTAYIRARQKRDDAHFAHDILPRALLLALVAYYDYFLREHIQALYSIRPELRSSLQVSYTIPELIEFNSVDAAVQYGIERHLDSVLRESHLAQIKWLERLLDMKLTDVPVLPQFLELTERRNLIAHCGGIVNSHYVSRCKSFGAAPGGEVGEALIIDQRYFEQSFNVVFELTVKLSQSTWRKVRPDEMALADHVLRSITYTLLVLERFDLARATLEFAHALKKHSSDHFSRIFTVNLAQCYKWLGDIHKCHEVMKTKDWTATEDSFILADRVLHDDFAEARRLMVRTASNGVIPEAAFRDWPLFREFRKSHYFQEAYMEVYGRPFAPGPFR